MKCRLEHIGASDSVSLVIGGYQLAPGFTTKLMDLSVSEYEVVQEWEEEGLIKIIPLDGNAKKVAVEGDVRPKRMTAEEVKELMNRKKRRKSTFTQKEMNTAHGVVRAGPSIGRPFGTKNARVLTAADLKHGVPKVPEQVELVEQEIEASGDKKKTMSAEDLKAGMHKEDKTEKITENDLGDKGANLQPLETGAKVMDETAVKAMNKATSDDEGSEISSGEETVQKTEDDDASEDDADHETEDDNITEDAEQETEETVGSEVAIEGQGEETEDENVSEDEMLGKFAKELDEMTKPTVTKIAKALGVEFKQSTNKPELVVMTGKKLIEKGYTEITEDLLK